MIRAVFLDLSGVLYIDRVAIPGALGTVERLQKTDLPLRFITNTSRRTRNMVLDDLDTIGFNIEDQQLFTATIALQRYLDKKGYQIFAINHSDIDSELESFYGDPPDAVVITDAAERFDYQSLNRAFRYLHDGAELIAIGENRFFKSQGELLLDAGPFIHALKYAADVEAVVIGKPAKTFFQLALDSVNLKAEEVLMIGDDAIGDVEGAIKAGLQGCLVKTGKYVPGDEHRIKVPGALLADDVTQAVERFVLNQ